MTNPDDLAKATIGLGEKSNGNAEVYGYGGLTKREWFAGLAMQGCMAYSAYECDIDKFKTIAVKMADALIEALNEKK